MTTIRKIILADSWDKAQARDVNEFNRDLVGVVNGGMRIADQFSGVRVGIRFNDASAAPRVGPFKSVPKWVLCLGARTLDTPSLQIGGAAVSWTMDGANVVVSSVSGLASATDYTIDLWIMEG